MKDVLHSPRNFKNWKNVFSPLYAVALIIGLDVLVHNSGNNWAAPLEEYVLILLIFDETNGNSLIPLGSECWA